MISCHATNVGLIDTMRLRYLVLSNLCGVFASLISASLEDITNVLSVPVTGIIMGNNGRGTTNLVS